MGATSGPPPRGRPLGEGELVLLRHREGDALLLRLRPGPQSIEGRGVIDLTPALGQPPGAVLQWAGTPYRVVRPTLPDLVQQLRRRAQIVTPKDAQQLLWLAGVGPGDRVGEAGAGSGALTIVLAWAVGPTGVVVSHDRRPDFLEVARRNLRLAGLEDRVRFVERDVAVDGLEGEGYSSVLLDLAEPWSVVPHLPRALAIGGHVAVYTPTYNQLERSVRELSLHGFEDLHSLEILERGLHVGPGGSRPEFEMLGHTGFLSGARWMGGRW